MIRRFLPLPILLEIIDLIINITGAVFLDLVLFAVDKDCSVFFSSDLISVLNFFLAFGSHRCPNKRL
jgi:hypothetical protein